MGLSGWRIGTVGGIAIEINSSWLVIFGLFFYDLGSERFQRLSASGNPLWPWVTALVATLLFFSSVVLHELSHSSVARRAGIEVSRITLFVFGGVAQVEEEPHRATDELLIALAGPGASIALSLVFGGLYWLSGALHAAPLVVECLQYVAFANLALAVFNMVPGFPMDGGRVLRSLLWYYWGDVVRATRVASLMGQAVGYALIALGVHACLGHGGLLAGIWYVVLGLLLQAIARQGYQRELSMAALSRASVGELAVPPGMVFQVGTPLGVVAAYTNAQPIRPWAPVLQAAQPVGVLFLSRLRHLPESQWASMAVEQAMDPLREEYLMRHSRPAVEAFDRLTATGLPELLVVDDWGNLQGVVTAETLAMAFGTRRR